MMLVSILSLTLLYEILGVMILMHAVWEFHNVMYDASKYPLCNPAAVGDCGCDDLHACHVGILQCHT